MKKLRKKNRSFAQVSFILAALTVLGLIVYSPTAYGGFYSGLVYTVSDGEAKIVDFYGSGDVTIPSEIKGYPVAVIGEDAFHKKNELTSVVIPDSVRTIEDDAFSFCRALKSVTFGNGLKRIGQRAFVCCESLEEAILPDSVEILDISAFADCYSLRTVRFGKNLSFVGEGTFFCCYDLHGITVDEKNESFISLDGVLYSKDLTEIVWCPISKTEISMPESVTIIGPSAFSECSNIKNLSIPENVTLIGNAAYEGCSITDLVIPDSVTEVGMAAFAHISSLKSVTFGSGLKKIPGLLFEGCGSLTYLMIPDGVTEIGKRAFNGCSSLKTITIPASVTEIDCFQVFDSCSSLTDIYYGGTRSVWNRITQDMKLPSQTTVHFGENPPPVVDPPVVDPPVVDPPTVDEPTVSFSDVKAGAFYADAVAWAVKKGITSGTSKTTFSPDAGCTRGQVVTFLWRAAGSPEPKSGKNPFSDVKTDDYFFKAVLWATENGVTTGTGKTTFSPSSVCTRGQIVTFLWRAAGSPEPKSGKNPFSDVGAEDYYFKAVLWAVEEGITKGTGAHSFSPASPCTRGQIVTFLYRNMG